MNPAWTAKEIGVVLELRNKRGHDYTQLHVLVPALKREVFICLEDFCMKPKETVEVCLKLHAESMPEITTRHHYSARSSTVSGGGRNFEITTGSISVVNSSNAEKKIACGVQVSDIRSSFSQFFAMPTYVGPVPSIPTTNTMPHQAPGFRQF